MSAEVAYATHVRRGSCDEIGGLAHLITRLADHLQEKARGTLDIDDVAHGQSRRLDLGVKLFGGMKMSGREAQPWWRHAGGQKANPTLRERCRNWLTERDGREGDQTG
jgi:hypothetical protein